MSKLYAIQHVPSGELLGLSVRSNGDDAEFCGDCTVELERYGESVWATTKLRQAQIVMEETIPWYNSGLDQPSLTRKLAAECIIVEWDQAPVATPVE